MYCFDISGVLVLETFVWIRPSVDAQMSAPGLVCALYSRAVWNGCVEEDIHRAYQKPKGPSPIGMCYRNFYGYKVSLFLWRDLIWLAADTFMPFFFHDKWDPQSRGGWHDRMFFSCLEGVFFCVDWTNDTVCEMLKLVYSANKDLSPESSEKNMPKLLWKLLYKKVR